MFETSVELLRATMHFTAGRPALEHRAAWHALPASRPPRRQIRERPLQLAGLPAIRIEPTAGATETTILYLHGGSFIWGQYAQYAETLARLALATGAAVLWLEYPLAPEHPHPAPLQAIRRALDQLQAASPGAPVFLAGDSAGGNLALATALAGRGGLTDGDATANEPLVADGAAMPTGCILISAWLDLGRRDGSLVANQETDWGLLSEFDLWARTYAAGADWTSPALSPARADPHGLCPTLVLYGEREMLRDQNEEWARRARAAGVPVTERTFPEMVHNWVMLASFTPQAGLALEEIARFVQTRGRPG
jgi:epsilon-lactone hydrolase